MGGGCTLIYDGKLSDNSMQQMMTISRATIIATRVMMKMMMMIMGMANMALTCRSIGAGTARHIHVGLRL